MIQLAEGLFYLHANNIGYFYEWNKIYINSEGKVKIADLTTAYRIAEGKDIGPLKMLKQKFPSLALSNVSDLANEKCHIYSLCLVCYRILHGDLPFN